jgi:hypothetical protein
LADYKFAQGDIVTTTVKCAHAETIVLTLDTTLPRPYSRDFRVHGTKAMYMEENNSLFIDGVHNKFDFEWKKQWNNVEQLREQYDHSIHCRIIFPYIGILMKILLLTGVCHTMKKVLIFLFLFSLGALGFVWGYNLDNNLNQGSNTNEADKEYMKTAIRNDNKQELTDSNLLSENKEVFTPSDNETSQDSLSKKVNSAHTGIKDDTDNKTGPTGTSDFSKYKTLTFSGYKWYIKSSKEPVGPGPNYFSDRRKNVWVDNEGKLHLKLTKKNDKWLCPEVICEQSLGFGKYIFNIDVPIDKLDSNVVLGLFTYDLSPGKNNREIDIEITRWGTPDKPPFNYTVQPDSKAENKQFFDAELNGTGTTHIIDWRNNEINFLSLHGLKDVPESTSHIIKSWKYSGQDIPSPGNEKVRMNLYLFQGKAPEDKKEIEVVIHEFKFVPYKTD